MVVVVVFPVVVMPPGNLVMIQLPVGSPLNTTLPVGVVQVGWVIVPIIGAVGGNGSLKQASLPSPAFKSSYNIPDELVVLFAETHLDTSTNAVA